jgi:hypothetical protein
VIGPSQKRVVKVENERKEFRAKPALVRRRDVSADLFSATCAAFGVDLTPQEAVNLEFPAQARNFEEFRSEYWIAEMWSKFPFELSGVDRDAAAMQSFREAEVRCKIANDRLYDGWARPWTSRVREPLLRAQKKLARLLAGITPHEVVQRAGWGPGASTSLNSSKCSHQHKWDLATHATRHALPWVHGLWNWAALPERQVNIVLGNKVTTVPKNAKTNRVIAVEPDWNMFFQRGLGSAIRSRLQRRCGLLTPDAQVKNQLLAREGSVSNGIATIDLRGASDGVSLALCELLLPPHVMEMIISLRSNIGFCDGQLGVYEKVSSMGNGFTFELETALFWAIASSVKEGDVSVYGDDITVAGANTALEVIELLEFCGFEVNQKKTFVTGPFRESCGGHYFQGRCVTPPYFRKPVDSLLRYISAGNSLSRRIDWREPALASRFGDAWRLLASGVPRTFRGPRRAGDVCLWTPFDMCTPEWDPSLQCFVGKGIRGTRRKGEAPIWGAIQSALHGDTHVVEYSEPDEVQKVCYWYADRWCDSTPSF